MRRTSVQDPLFMTTTRSYSFMKQLVKDAADEAVKDATGKTINETFDSAIKSIKTKAAIKEKQDGNTQK